jgi:hypothetical protein
VCVTVAHYSALYRESPARSVAGCGSGQILSLHDSAPLRPQQRPQHRPGSDSPRMVLLVHSSPHNTANKYAHNTMPRPTIHPRCTHKTASDQTYLQGGGGLRWSAVVVACGGRGWTRLAGEWLVLTGDRLSGASVFFCRWECKRQTKEDDGE